MLFLRRASRYAFALLLVIYSVQTMMFAFQTKQYHQAQAEVTVYKELYHDAIHEKISDLADRIVQVSGRRCGISPRQAINIATIFVVIGKKEEVPSELLAAVADRESCFNQAAVGQAREIGLMQIKEGTARLYGFPPDRIHSEYGNVEVAARILSLSLREFPLRQALLIYNQGHPGESGNPYPSMVIGVYERLSM